MKEWNKFKMK